MKVFLREASDDDYFSRVEQERSNKGMYVCEYCLEEIESHEGRKRYKIYYPDEMDEQDSRCDWCEDCGFDTLYHIR